MSHFLRETLEQPHSLQRLLDEGLGNAERVAREVHRARPQWVLVAARGSSDNAARYAQYLFGAHNGLAVALAAPSLFSRYRRPPSLKGAWVLAISQSGRSPDVVSVLAEAKRQGALGVAVTNEPDSPLARQARLTLPLLAGTERAVAATKTYSHQLLSVAMLSAALEGSLARLRALARVPKWLDQALRRNEKVAHVAGSLGKEQHLAVVGRGFNLATAFELALKLKETSRVVAEPFSSADFLHGPIAMVQRGFPVLLVSPTSSAFRGEPWALLELLLRRGAKVPVISDNARLLHRADIPLPLPNGVPEWLSPLVAIGPGQLLAHGLARARGQNPDAPFGLSKVTRTR